MKPSEYLALVKKGVDDEVACGGFQLFGNPELEIQSEHQVGDMVNYGLTYSKHIIFGDGSRRTVPSTIQWGIQRSFRFTGQIYSPEEADNILTIGCADSGVSGFWRYGEMHIETDLEKVTYVGCSQSSTFAREIALGTDIGDAISKAFKEISSRIQKKGLAIEV